MSIPNEPEDPKKTIPDFSKDLVNPKKPFHYLGNRRLKGSGIVIPFTGDHVNELQECAEDVFYFAENYYMIVHVDRGKEIIKLRPYQKRMIDSFQNNRFNIALASRQTGKSTSFALHVLHYILFNEDKHVLILANKEKQSKEILSRIKMAYENLPFWLQSGVQEWNKMSIKLDNGCTVTASSTSSDSARGGSYSMVIIDEMAFISAGVWDDFYSSVYPTISSGQETQVIIISTPNGMNQFYEMWNESIKGENEYHPTHVRWEEVAPYATRSRSEDFENHPYEDEVTVYDTKLKDEYECPIGALWDFWESEEIKNFTLENHTDNIDIIINKEDRFKILEGDTGEYVEFHGLIRIDGRYNLIDSKWKNETIRNVKRKKFQQEYDCKFLASTDSLIDIDYIEKIKFKTPIPLKDTELYEPIMKLNTLFEKFVFIYEEPYVGHEYMVGLDAAKITEISDGDNLAIQIVDVTRLPFKQVATVIIPSGIHYLEIPEPLAMLGYYFNEATIFIENNDQVGFEVADAMFLDWEYENLYIEKPGETGFRTTTKNKRIGCLNIKQLIERDLLTLCDFQTISQISTFVKSGNSYKAQKGYNDDAIMALIHAFVFLMDRMGFEEIIELVRRAGIDVNADPRKPSNQKKTAVSFGKVEEKPEEVPYDQEPIDFFTMDDVNHDDPENRIF